MKITPSKTLTSPHRTVKQNPESMSLLGSRRLRPYLLYLLSLAWPSHNAALLSTDSLNGALNGVQLFAISSNVDVFIRVT